MCGGWLLEGRSGVWCGVSWRWCFLLLEGRSGVWWAFPGGREYVLRCVVGGYWYWFMHGGRRTFYQGNQYVLRCCMCLCVCGIAQHGACEMEYVFMFVVVRVRPVMVWHGGLLSAPNLPLWWRGTNMYSCSSTVPLACSPCCRGVLWWRGRARPQEQAVMQTLAHLQFTVPNTPPTNQPLSQDAPQPPKREG